MITKVSRTLLGSRWLFISALLAMLVAATVSYTLQVRLVRQNIEQTFDSRARLIKRILQLNLEQIAAMRNLYVEAYNRESVPIMRVPVYDPSATYWFLNSPVGAFTGLSTHPLDAQMLREMQAAEGMRSVMEAGLEMNTEIAWQYYISAQHFSFAAWEEDAAKVRFQESLYERPYWLQSIPGANPLRKPILAGPYEDSWGKGTVLTTAAPVYSGDQFLGVVAIDSQTSTLMTLVELGSAVGRSVLVSENNHMIGNQQLLNQLASQTLPLTGNIGSWIKDSNGALWLSRQVVEGEMWLLHRTTSAEIYRAAAIANASNWLLILILGTLLAYYRRVIHLLSKISELSFHDALTGLPNRRLLEDRLSQALLIAERNQRLVALLFVDLDKFKPVNDIHGHDAGDWLLKQVSDRIKSRIRKSDTLARVGGDEFVILLPDLHFLLEAVNIAEDVRTSLNHPFLYRDSVSLEISSSIGIACYPVHASTAHELTTFGDKAMYIAKQQGRNRVVVFSENNAE